MLRERQAPRKQVFFTLFIKLSHCHFTEAGRERAREGEQSDRQRLQGSFSRQLRAGSGTEPFVPGKFSRRESWSLLKRKTSGEIKWREVGREEREIVLG